MSDEINIGGQAVIEGVMMRGPKGYSIAVRRANGEIEIKNVPNIPISKRYKFWGLPFVRGAVTLFEMLIIGIKALNYSANIAMEEAENKKEEPLKQEENKSSKKNNSQLSVFSLVITMVLAFAITIVLFIILPNLAAHYLGNLEIFHSGGAKNISSGNFREETSPLLYNIISGIIRVIIFILYIVFISFMKDIQRLFQYHGAEHKSIYAYENGKELIPEEAMNFTTLHPRCGTSFIFVVMIIAIIAFSIVPKIILIVSPGYINLHFALKKAILFPLHIVLMPFIAGISYEIIKFASKHPQNQILHLLVLPGILFQKITTKEPDKSQVEVAIAALKAVISEQ